jgi:hypothetical protein
VNAPVFTRECVTEDCHYAISMAQVALS